MKFGSGMDGESPLSPYAFPRLKKIASARFVIVDKNGRIIALFAGRPDNADDWDEVASRASDALTEARRKCTFTKARLVHARGNYPTQGVGTSFGGGSQVRTSVVLWEYPRC